MKHAIDVEYLEGGNVTYYANSKQSADDFAERVFETGPQALSAVVRLANASESNDMDDDATPTGDAQCDQILSFMKRNGSITSWDAMHECACMRLASRIYDLRCRGYNIVSTMIKNNGKRYAQYRLKE